MLDCHLLLKLHYCLCSVSYTHLAPNINTLSKLRNYVLEYNCDLGIATDGDADRIGAVSYTHLDVYKRQLLNQRGISLFLNRG